MRVSYSRGLELKSRRPHLTQYCKRFTTASIFKLSWYYVVELTLLTRYTPKTALYSEYNKGLVYYEILCFMIFLVFPNGCVTFQGPHPDLCKQQIFLNAGCLERGQVFHTLKFYEELDDMNLM